MPILRLLVVLALLVAACGTDGDGGDDAAADTGLVDAAVDAELPAGSEAFQDRTPANLTTSDTWYWQIQGELRTDVVADVYDIDLFDVSAEAIADLRTAGIVVICYFSAGSAEDFREDTAALDPAALGNNLEGYDDERWLDIRNLTVRDLMDARISLAADKGCDGVEPDNVTAFQNDTGFDITADDQIDFNRYLTFRAHARDLLIGLKNDLDQIAELEPLFDFAVNEQCHEFDECEANAPFIAAGKPVFNAEYVGQPADFCGRARSLGIRSALFSIELDGSIYEPC